MCLYVQSFFRLQHRACSHHSAVLSFSKSQVTRRARNTLCRFRPDGILLGEMLLDRLGEALRLQSSRCASTGPLVHKLARFEMPSIVPSSDFASSTLLSRFHASRFLARSSTRRRCERFPYRGPLWRPSQQRMAVRAPTSLSKHTPSLCRVLGCSSPSNSRSVQNRDRSTI